MFELELNEFSDILEYLDYLACLVSIDNTLTETKLKRWRSVDPYVDLSEEEQELYMSVKYFKQLKQFIKVLRDRYDILVSLSDKNDILPF